VKELIALVHAQPGKISYASSGAGGQQHLAMESIRTLAGNMDMIHVPYKGFGQGIADVLANQVRSSSAASPRRSSHPERQAQGAGRHRPEASQGAADVPAIAETLPGFDITPGTASWRPRARRATS